MPATLTSSQGKGGAGMFCFEAVKGRGKGKGGQVRGGVCRDLDVLVPRELLFPVPRALPTTLTGWDPHPGLFDIKT